MKKKSTIWIAIIMILLVAFFLKIGFTKSSEKDNKKDSKEKKLKKWMLMWSNLHFLSPKFLFQGHY